MAAVAVIVPTVLERLKRQTAACRPHSLAIVGSVVSSNWGSPRLGGETSPQLQPQPPPPEPKPPAEPSRVSTECASADPTVRFPSKLMSGRASTSRSHGLTVTQALLANMSRKRTIALARTTRT